MDSELLFAEYRADMVSRRLSPRSVEMYDRMTGLYAAWLDANGVRADEARRPHIQAWLYETGWAPSTQQVALAWVRAAYRYAVDEELLDRDPCRRVRAPEIPERVPRTVPAETIRTLEANCRDWKDALLLRMFSYTGARTIEVRRVSWNDVDTKAGTMHLLGKGDRERTIPIHPKLREALREAGMSGAWVLSSNRGGQLGDDGLYFRWRRLVGDLDVQKHDFRRTVVSNLRRNGVDRSVIKSIIGHSRRNEGAWSAYDAVSMPEMQLGILRLYADDPV